MQRIPRKSLPSLMSFTLALAAPALLADPDVSVTGGMLNVTVPEKHIGARLLLVWDDADKGDNPALWANSHEVAATVPAADTHYAVDLLSLGITNGQPCRLITTDQYRMLDKLKMPSKQTYVDTGIPDTEVYGVRFGFYGNECAEDQSSGAFANFIGSNDGTGSFTLGKNNASFSSWYGNYRGTALPRPSVRTDSINDVAFVNQTYSVNGTTVQTGLEAGSVGYSGANMHIGAWAVKFRFLFGWWSYVRFDDADGNAILDYIPVKRYGDDTVGFYDRATGKFVTSSAGGAFTAGTVTNNMFSVTASAQAFTPTNLVGLDVKGSRVRITVPPFYAGESLMVVWDDADRGGNIADWAHSSIIADAIGNAGGTYTFHLSNLGVQDRQICGVFVGLRLRLLDMLKMTSKQTYVDTGIPDTDVYGVRFGFYGNECAPDGNPAGTFANLIGTKEDEGGFTLGMNNSSFSSWYWVYRGTKDDSRPAVNTDSINDVAFANQTFTLNGVVKKTGLPTGSVGTSGYNMHIGTWSVRWRFLYGWWSYVRFDDADGNAMLDYIPVQRIADDAVGFYDRATGKFVLSTGGGAFTAGTVTNSLATIAHSFQTFMKVDIPTTLYIR